MSECFATSMNEQFADSERAGRYRLTLTAAVEELAKKEHLHLSVALKTLMNRKGDLWDAYSVETMTLPPARPL